MPQIRLSACLNRLFSMFASWHKTIVNFENPSRPTFLTITTFINTMKEDNEWSGFSDSDAAKERHKQLQLLYLFQLLQLQLLN